ncbi:MAG: sensor histidine kinase [Bacteroidetes bacterium]|nr:MAG: sensor histidine kinase [Bacteroidota bacterium]
MQLKLKLTLLFTLLAGAILALFALIIYFSASIDRKNEFYSLLQKEAITRANVLLGAGVPAETLQTIYMEHREIINEVEVAIYTPDFTLLYHDAVEIDFVKETPEMIREILEKGEIRFTQEGWEVVGVHYVFQGESYILTAAAYDEYGHTKLANLIQILLLSWLVSVVIIFFAGRFFAWRALQPVSQMVEKAEEISATQLGLRLSEGNGKDELAELAITFNEMLDRLENSFDAQKEFVSSIAHELRTPLAAIVGEAELTLSQQRNPDDYRQALGKIHDDAMELSKLAGGLLDLAKASYEPEQISMKDIRIDEVMLDARHELLKLNPGYHVELGFEENFDDESILNVRGNEYLLKIAFVNLMENACKFSADKRVEVTMKVSQGKPGVVFSDKGIGIPEEEMELILKPFYRGKNSRDARGSGIGLSLVQRIVRLHKAQLILQSDEGKGTTVAVNWG